MTDGTTTTRAAEELIEATPAARAYRAALPSGRLIAFPIAPLDRLGVPAWVVVHLDELPVGDSVQLGVGYGATDADALLGAMGELAEFAHCYRALQAAPRRTATYAELAREVGSRGVADPLTLCLPAGSPVDADTRLEWVPGKRYTTGETVLLPAEIAASFPTDLTPGYAPFTTPISNGMGAGPTLEWALAHGIQELLQRDGNGLRFRALDRGVVLDLDGAVRDPATLALLDRLASAGIEALPKFATDEFGVANVYVVGRDEDTRTPLPLMTTACGEAASPDRERALRKAMLEFAAARARKCFMHGPLDLVATVAPAEYLRLYQERYDLAWEEGRALEAMIGWLSMGREELTAVVADTVLSKRSTKAFSELPTWAAPAEEVVPGKALCDELVGRLTKAGLDVLYLDAAPPNAAEAGVHAVKAIVPGLEVETMSYLRIGERNARKLLDDGSELVGRGAPAPGRLPVRLTAAATERLGGPVWLDPAAVERRLGKLYPLYREPEFHAAQMVMAARRREAA
jgi:ribosomal protein S12 methylthiotransferase accessory factor